MAKKLAHADPATQEMLAKAAKEQIDVVWDRYEKMKPQCGFGQKGICCRNCSMGPCRINPNAKEEQLGICGANADTIVARNLARMIAAGAAAHSDHGREIAHSLLKAAQNPNGDYQIKDEKKLKALADVYNIKTDERSTHDLAAEVARAALREFGQYEGIVKMTTTAPTARQQLWQSLDITPRAIDREIVEIMHRTHIGVDADFQNIIRQGLRVAIGDGWGGSMIGSEISDILFGTPNPLKSSANLGVLKADQVNVVVHGHEPTLSDIIATVSQDEILLKEAKMMGATGINIAGICCTANEILMRHGIPLAGSFLQQELALMTGSVDLMVADVQCIMPGLNEVAKCFHTRHYTTSSKAKIPGFDHLEFKEEKAVQIAKKLLMEAIKNFPNRIKSKVQIPSVSEKLVAGFSSESLFHILGGRYRATYRPLNDAIISGRLRGAAAVIGCSNPNYEYEKGHIQIVKELIKNDTLVVTTGCNAVSCANHGLLQPEVAYSLAGQGLKEICEALGIPPILHLGSCVDNSRILRILTNIIAEGGLGDDISDLPIAGAAPEWMSEKAVSIGFYFVASGVYTVTGHPLPITGSNNLVQYLTDKIEKETGGKWDFELDPIEAAHKMLNHIDKKRKALNLKPAMYNQAFPVKGKG